MQTEDSCYIEHFRDLLLDRILIAQAINHSLVLISRDIKFDAYPIVSLWD